MFQPIGQTAKVLTGSLYDFEIEMQILDKKPRGRAPISRESRAPRPHARKVAMPTRAVDGQMASWVGADGSRRPHEFAQHERTRRRRVVEVLPHLAARWRSGARRCVAEDRARSPAPGHRGGRRSGPRRDDPCVVVPGRVTRRGSSTPGVVRQNPGGVGRNIAGHRASRRPPRRTAAAHRRRGRRPREPRRAHRRVARGGAGPARRAPVRRRVHTRRHDRARSRRRGRRVRRGHAHRRTGATHRGSRAQIAADAGRAAVCGVEETAPRTSSTTSWSAPSASWASGPTTNGSRSCGSSPCPSPSRFAPRRRCGGIDYASPNAAECRAMANATRRGRGSNPRPMDASIFEFTSAEAAVAEMRDDVEVLLDAGVGAVVLTLGALGCVLCRGGGGDWRHVPALGDGPPLRSLVGAGDALVAGAAPRWRPGGTTRPPSASGSRCARRAAESDGNVPAGHSLPSLERDAGTMARVRTMARGRRGGWAARVGDVRVRVIGDGTRGSMIADSSPSLLVRRSLLDSWMVRVSDSRQMPTPGAASSPSSAPTCASSPWV